MMNSKKTVGIICEYNPFHGGHRYQIEEMRKQGFDRVVCVMSGNTVQRGEFAIADKYTRAETALEGGADLVLELPYPYSASSAEFFALAGVRILENAGVDAICFGSECGDVDKLKKAADVCDSEAFVEAYKNSISSGNGTAKAYFDAYKNVANEELPGGANDILGIAYLRALKRENSNIEPIALKRRGSDYRNDSIEDLTEYPSATMLRNYICENGINDKFADIVPKETFAALIKAAKSGRAPVKMSNLDSAIIAHLRLFDASKLEEIADVGGGLGERILSASHKVTTYKELVLLVSGKQYTEARVRRAILNILTGVVFDDLKAYPAYTTVLGFNYNGREMLSELRKKEKNIAFITKPADAESIGEKATRQIYLDRRADALFTLATPLKTDSGEYVRKFPIYIYN